MSRLDKLIELGGKTFDSVEEFIKAIQEIWEGEEIHLGYILSAEQRDFVGLDIDTEDGEYIAHYTQVEDRKIMFVALEEVE